MRAYDFSELPAAPWKNFKKVFDLVMGLPSRRAVAGESCRARCRYTHRWFGNLLFSRRWPQAYVCCAYSRCLLQDCAGSHGQSMID